MGCLCRKPNAVTVLELRVIGRREAGFVLVTNLLILALLTALGITLLRMTTLEEKMSGNQKLLANAQFGAERGISEAVDDLLSEAINDSGSETSTSWQVLKPGPNATDYYDSAENTYSAADNYGFNFIVSHKVVGGVVATNTDGNPYYQINAMGVSGGASRSIEAVVGLEYSSATWEDGMVGCSGVQFDSNASTGSYSSSGAVSTGDNGDVKTIESPGNIAFSSDAIINGNLEAYGTLSMDSNSVIAKDALVNGNISLSSNACIGSDAYSNGSISGSSGSGSCDLSGGGATSGILGTQHPNQTNPLVELEDCDPLDVDTLISGQASIATSNDNGSYGVATSYFESSGVPDLGTDGVSTEFYFTQLSMKDGTTLIRGDVTLYIDGNFHMLGTQQLNFAANATLTVYMTGSFRMDSNARANVNGTPANFMIYSNATDSGSVSDSANSSMIMNSNTGFWGVVYAPKAYVYVDSNAKFRGAVRGKQIYSSSNFDFDYDEDLASLAMGSPSPTNYQLVYWTEQAYEGSGTTTSTSSTTTTTTTAGTTTSTTSTTTTTTTTTSTTTSTTTTTTTTTTQLPDIFDVTNVDCDAGNKILDVTLQNNRGNACKITGVSISWPSANDSLKEIKVNDNQVYDQEKSCCSTNITGGWKSGTNGDRTINSGASKTVTFQFNNTAVSGPYDIRITTDSCGSQTLDTLYCN